MLLTWQLSRSWCSHLNTEWASPIPCYTLESVHRPNVIVRRIITVSLEKSFWYLLNGFLHVEIFCWGTFFFPPKSYEMSASWEEVVHCLQQVTKHVPATDEASIHRAQLRVKTLLSWKYAFSTCKALRWILDIFYGEFCMVQFRYCMSTSNF